MIPNSNIPNDETGDALRRLLEDGARLSERRDVDFYIVAADIRIARHIIEAVAPLGFRTSMEEGDQEWVVCCTKTIPLDYASISTTELTLEKLSRSLGAQLDGWGALGS